LRFDVVSPQSFKVNAMFLQWMEGCVLLRSYARHSEGIFAFLASLRALRETGTQIVVMFV
jgi:hypothetical protein